LRVTPICFYQKKTCFRDNFFVPRVFFSQQTFFFSPTNFYSQDLERPVFAAVNGNAVSQTGEGAKKIRNLLLLFVSSSGESKNVSDAQI
jgi:hypothetical protein